MSRKGINSIVRIYLNQRFRQLQRSVASPFLTQERQWQELLQKARLTEWGNRHDALRIRRISDFQQAFPLTGYEDLQPYIERMMYGEANVLWPGKVRWFSKSSGTTGAKSKFIPVSAQNLRQTHIQGAWDTMALFYQARPDARCFSDKTMLMGGSLSTFQPYPQTIIGDVSAIMINNMPWIGRIFFIPDRETALLAAWEEKLELLAQAGARERNVIMIGGVPTWTVVLFRRILEITGKDNMLEVWPDFQVYTHGGVSFTPYRAQFEQFFPSPKVSYQEIYNASEGYFAVQDDLEREGMLLLLQNGMFYEFLPLGELEQEHPRALTLEEVETGRHYAIVISTNSGLWRYMPGDTVMFTSLDPFRIKVTGRTKQYINVFGEEVMVDNTDKALALACAQTGASVQDYTVAPIYLMKNARGGHEWLIEFEKMPANVEHFANLLDHNLQQLNSDYEAKRYRDMALGPLQVRVMPKGTFLRWMKSRGKLGGQHKVPRLANSRVYIDDILSFLGEKV